MGRSHQPGADTLRFGGKDQHTPEAVSREISALAKRGLIERLAAGSYYVILRHSKSSGGEESRMRLQRVSKLPSGPIPTFASH